LSKAASDTLEKVSEEFESEVLADLQEGRSQARATVESARKEAAAAVQKILETSVKQAESLKRQIIGAAELESRDAQLRSMEKAVNEVFGLAVEELKAGSGSAYQRALGRLVQEGLDVIGPRAKISCSSRDRKTVAAAVRTLNGGKVKLTLDDESIETIGGVVLLTPDGSVRFDNTFEARLERSKSTLRKEVAGILTGA
jgi:V/A-type H+-transporting ATPase subunit E